MADGEEFEVKILEVDVDAIIQKLEKLGAKIIFEGPINAYYYDTKDNEIEKNGEVFRLRLEGEKAILEFKSPITKSNNNEMGTSDLILEVSSLDTQRKILKKLGYQEKYPSEKYRIEYKHGNIKIAIDRYQGRLSYIPAYIELETTEDHLKERNDLAKELGYNKDSQLDWKIKHLVDYYQSKSKG